MNTDILINKGKEVFPLSLIRAQSLLKRLEAANGMAKDMSTLRNTLVDVLRDRLGYAGRRKEMDLKDWENWNDYWSDNWSKNWSDYTG